MKILTLIKYSMDVAEIKVDPQSKELRLSGVPEKIGNIDKNVVEAAVRLKGSCGADVIGMCLGPKAAVDTFKDVLAMGMDEVYLIEDEATDEKDGRTASRILEAAIRKTGPFDLILCGFASDDGYSYQIGPRLAERLDLPLVSFVSRLDLHGERLEADRNLDRDLQTVAVQLPALVSVAEEAFPPRRTTLMDAIKAKKKPVNVLQIESDLGFSAEQLEQWNGVASASKLGVVVHRKNRVFKGKPAAELADLLIDALIEENVLKGAS